jgi:hypothetical protein
VRTHSPLRLTFSFIAHDLRDLHVYISLLSVCHPFGRIHRNLYRSLSVVAPSPCQPAVGLAMRCFSPPLSGLCTFTSRVLLQQGDSVAWLMGYAKALHVGASVAREVWLVWWWHVSDACFKTGCSGCLALKPAICDAGYHRR